MILPKLTWTTSPNFSSRGGSPVRLIVCHDCEGGYAGSVSWFAQARSRVSAHIVLKEDGSEATQMVSWANKAWHVMAYNSVSEGIECAGFSAKGLGTPEWQALANIVAFRLHARGLPPAWAKGGVGHGFCQHADLGAAGGGHHDITPDPKVWEAFCSMVEKAYGEPQPAAWPANTSSSVQVAPAGWTPSGTVRHDLVPGSMEWVQTELNIQQPGPTHLLIDGLDGPSTRFTLKSFQRSHGLVPDGVVGPETIAALEKGATPKP